MVAPLNMPDTNVPLVMHSRSQAKMPSFEMQLKEPPTLVTKCGVVGYEQGVAHVASAQPHVRRSVQGWEWAASAEHS